MNHIDDLAELYALGALEQSERSGVEVHARTCPGCLRRLHEAEEAVLCIAQEEPQHVPSPKLRVRVGDSLSPASRSAVAPWLRPLLALAAVLVIAVLPISLLMARQQRMHVTLAAQDAALSRIAAGSFAYAPFVGHAAAKVLYSRDGSWYYVVVMHPAANMRVAYVHDGTMEDLGPVSMHGATGTLYLPVNHKMNELALLSGGQVVADATLAY